MIYFLFYLIFGFFIVLFDWFFFVNKEVKNNGNIFLLPLCMLFWPIYLIAIIFCRCFIKRHKTSDLDKGFHPEILYEINKDYAEYVDFKEVN